MLKQVGKYTISERIGRGTYSRVYRAVDSQGRPVAIKVSTTQSDPEQLADFQKDLVAAASVTHPNLVAVHDLGFEDDFPYLVMELVEGRDLDKLRKGNAAPALAERIRVMQQVGDALKNAHEREIYHLDIRPSKIMLTEDGGAKLLDLGLGRLSFDPARVTDHGYLVGAPFYMGPERLTAIDTANERCDIWSYGVTFYEWLSGRHPFYDDDGEQMVGNIMDATPRPLDNVPTPLNALILRAMEKEPSQRYQNFAELLADLKPLMTELKREESDALMAEAMKQTDSGRWHEARRIGRQMRDRDPQQANNSQMFGASEPEPERDWQAPERARPAASVQPVASPTRAVATAVDTPEPAPLPPPPPVQAPARAASLTATAAAAAVFPASASPIPRPQRPERTAPKIPTIGARNGSTVSGNGKPTAAPTNSARTAAVPAAAPAPGRPRIRTASAPANGTAKRSTPYQPTIRVLEVSDSLGFPWVRVLGFTVPTLLMAGGLFFFLRSTPRTGSTEDAKKVAADRVISSKLEHDSTKALTKSASGQPTEIAQVTPPADPAAAKAASVTDPNAPPPLWRAFDPKTLQSSAQIKPVVRRAGSGSLAKLAPPALANGAAVTEGGSLPVSLNAPPPPAPTPAPAPAAEVPATPTVAAATATVEPANDGIVRGGLVSQPILVGSVPPIYPPTAVQRKTQGVVRFQATIAKDGSVKNLQLLSGDPLLNVAAKQAVLQWKYKPAMLNGQPVEVVQGIVVKFNLNQQ